MTTWGIVKLGDVADEVTVGHVGSMAGEYKDSGIPFLRSQNVRPYRIDLSDVKYINEGFHDSLKKSALRPGDVVTVRTGAPGQTAVVPDWLTVANCSDLIILRAGEALDPRWISYYLNWVTKTTVSGLLVGAVQQHFNVKAVKGMKIDMPPLVEQRRIAEMLGALDDKIAINQRVVALSAELSSGIWQRDSDLEGKRSVPLSSLAEFVNGRAFTKDATGTGRVVVRISELNSGIGASTVFNDIEVSDENLARPGDLLFAWSGSLTVARWYRDEAIINQHIFKVIPKVGNRIWLVDQALRSLLDQFKSIAADKATTMGHIQRKHLDELVTIPPEERIAASDDLMQSLWQRALAAERESLQLAKTRDELLPLLMSGKLRVKDAEKKVEELV